MRFHAEHSFPGPCRRVAELLADPSFYLGLVLPDLDQPELIGTTEHGDRVTIRLRYEFAGHLDPMAARLIGPGRPAWIQEVGVDRAAASGALTFEAERAPRRLHGRADFALEPSERGTIRRLDGELVVAMPGIGRMAERRIVPGLLSRLDIEAREAAALLA